MKATVQIRFDDRDATVSCEFDDSAITQLRSEIMAAFDDLLGQVDGLDTAVTELQDALTTVVTSEHDQVMAAIEALKADAADVIKPEQVAAFTARVDSVKARLLASRDAVTSAIQSVYEPDEPTEPPAEPLPDEPPPAPEVPTEGV